MKTIAIVLGAAALVACCAGPVAAQPKHGDLIAGGSKIVLAVDPATGVYTTLYDFHQYNRSSCFNSFVGEVRMAENNRELAVAVNSDCLIATNWVVRNGDLLRLDPFQRALIGFINYSLPAYAGFRLDHDGVWVAAGADLYNWTGWDSQLGGFGPVSTVWYARSAISTAVPFDNLVIDRDPGASTYVFRGFGSLLRADRNGIVGTLGAAPASAMRDLDMDDRTGHYVAIAGDSVYLVDKSGTTLRSFRAFGQLYALTANGDGTAWLLSNDKVGMMDLRTGQITRTVGVGFERSFTSYWAQGLVVFGSRPLVCRQAPTSAGTVSINVQSRHPAAAGKSYALAASPSRRPGLKLAGGEWLALDVTHPLFWLTAQNQAPGTFVNFRGVLDANGNNAKPVTIKIPTNLPKQNGLTIFVAGVIFDPASNRIIEVTNTHWCVLP